jgi:hypothetical protein
MTKTEVRWDDDTWLRWACIVEPIVIEAIEHGEYVHRAPLTTRERKEAKWRFIRQHRDEILKLILPQARLVGELRYSLDVAEAALRDHRTSATNKPDSGRTA